MYCKECKPFLITQICDKQNMYLINHGTVTNREGGWQDKNEIEFNNELYKYLDYKKIPNTLRLFDLSKYYYLTYYWNSTLKEPGSNRGGLYLISGLEIKKPFLKENPRICSSEFMSYFHSILFFSDVDSFDLSNPVLRDLWCHYKNGSLDLALRKILEMYNQERGYTDLEILNFIKRSLESKKLFKRIDYSRQLTLKPKKIF